jgi:hypothetical protein
LEELLALEEECAPRIADGAEAFDATFGLGLFESPRHDALDDWETRKGAPGGAPFSDC